MKNQISADLSLDLLYISVPRKNWGHRRFETWLRCNFPYRSLKQQLRAQRWDEYTIIRCCQAIENKWYTLHDWGRSHYQIFVHLNW